MFIIYNRPTVAWIHQFFLSFSTKDFYPKNIKRFPCDERKQPANGLRNICVKSEAQTRLNPQEKRRNKLPSPPYGNCDFKVTSEKLLY